MSVTNQLLAFVRDHPNCIGREICDERARIAEIDPRPKGYGWFTLRGMVDRGLVVDQRHDDLMTWYQDRIAAGISYTIVGEERDRKLAELGIHQYTITTKGLAQLERALRAATR